MIRRMTQRLREAFSTWEWLRLAVGLTLTAVVAFTIAVFARPQPHDNGIPVGAPGTYWDVPVDPIPPTSEQIVSAATTLPIKATEGPQGPANRTPVDWLRQEADVVAKGKVTSVESDWNANRTLIVTTVLIDVSTIYKGQPGGTMVVRELGGTVGEISQYFSGGATYKPGEEVIVFARRRSDGGYATLAGQSGRLAVSRSAGEDAQALRVDGEGAQRAPLGVVEASLGKSPGGEQ